MEKKKLLSIMKNTLALLMLTATISALNADEDYYQQGIEFAQKMFSKSKVDLEKTFTDVKDLESKINEVEMLLSETGEGSSCKNCTSASRSTITNKSNWKTDTRNGIIVFISFSMPDIVIKELCEKADKYGATVVLRGLHEDSFLKTKDKILEICPNGLSLLIHPDLFKQYSISRVPTFVKVKEDQEIARLSGNVTLDFAISKLEEQ